MVKIIRIAEQRANGIKQNEHVQRVLNTELEELFRNRGNEHVEHGKQTHERVVGIPFNQAQDARDQAKSKRTAKECEPENVCFFHRFKFHSETPLSVLFINTSFIVSFYDRKVNRKRKKGKSLTKILHITHIIH
jgi:hypothetical protein